MIIQFYIYACRTQYYACNSFGNYNEYKSDDYNQIYIFINYVRVAETKKVK